VKLRLHHLLRGGLHAGGILIVVLAATRPAADAEPGGWQSLDQNQLQQAFRLLDERYLDRETLDPLTWNRAAFLGLTRLLPDGAVQLVLPDSGNADAPPIAFASGTLSQNRGYLRLAGEPEPCLEALDKALAAFRDASCQDLILDLRCPQSSLPGSFSFAAEVAGRFLPSGRILFELKSKDAAAPPRVYSSRASPSWEGTLAILCDADTTPAGEVIASVLRDQLKATLIGEPTPGRMLEYEEHPLSAEATLRFAVAAVVFPDGRSALGQKVEPQLVAHTAPSDKYALYQAVDSGARSVEDSIAESPRPRMNEAALVAGTNPELPYLLQRARGEPHPADTPPQIDRALQLAVDSFVVRKRMKTVPE
jgi:hypothetical protein